VYLSVAISKISTRENTLVDDDGLFFVINARQLFTSKMRERVLCVCVERVRYAQVLCLGTLEFCAWGK
jgi:hypothetical protein